jgi:hypothetical protein
LFGNRLYFASKTTRKQNKNFLSSENQINGKNR